jgi:uncharacterized membrane protein YuzA (DUF378 family)
MEQKMSSGFSAFNKVLAVLAIIGAINWGLVGFFQWNLVAAIFDGNGAQQAGGFSRFIYALVGLAGLALAFTFPWGRRVIPGRAVEARRIDTRREVHP